MNDTYLLGISVGLTLTLANGLIAIAVIRHAAGMSDSRFMKQVVGSIAIRMFVLLLAVISILLTVPLDAFAFGVSLVAGVIVSLILEMWFLLRWARLEG